MPSEKFMAAGGIGHLLLIVAVLLVGLLILMLLMVSWRRYQARLQGRARASSRMDIWQASGQRLVHEMDQQAPPPADQDEGEGDDENQEGDEDEDEDDDQDADGDDAKPGDRPWR